MDKEQIKKALEYHISGKLANCEYCPFDKVNKAVSIVNQNCSQTMCENALALINSQDQKIFELENRLKECENGYEGTLHLDRCKLHDAEQKIKELIQANEQLSESYDHLEKTKDELLSERSRLTAENERLRAEKEGKWITPTTISGRAFNVPHCSVCGGIPCGVDENTKYCPNCGAKMKGENDEIN